MKSKSKPISIEVNGKKILLGTAEIIEQHGNPVYNPDEITGIRIKKINISRAEMDEVDLT